MTLHGSSCTYDLLTGLLDRCSLLDALGAALNETRRTGQPRIVAKLDIDDFSSFNRLHGHLAGDTLLSEIGARLNAKAYRAIVAGRTGSDELIVIFPSECGGGHPTAGLARDAGRRLAHYLGRPLRSARLSWSGKLNMAAILVRQEDTDVDMVLWRLDDELAAARCSAGLRDITRLADDSHSNASALSEGAIRKALTRREFLLHYQPQHNSVGDPVGVEALARWLRPDGTNVPPGCFIPYAEAIGLIIPLGRDIVRMACVQLTQWQSMPIMSRQRMSVNVSPRQLLEPSFAADIRSIVRESGAQPTHLTLELTESQPISDLAQARASIHALFDEGIRFALDDFGTGYASLASVSRLPLEELKIDRSFISGVVGCARSAGVVYNMIALARHLGLHVTAEGVETAAQRELLVGAGCDKFQGYFYAPPLPAAEVTKHVLLHSADSGQNAIA
ncbi:MAG: GGDEF domain-containing protein [Alphaproteobacteria bacterium]|nr:MAG: GGDEF domain-containing protein [Alphaproteobacteria bacterium]